MTYLFIFRRLGYVSLLFFGFILFSKNISAQAVEEDKTPYVSSIDQLFTVRHISVLPVAGNMKGIYSRPMENHLIELIQKDHHWDYVKSASVGPIMSPDELEESPEKLKRLSRQFEADAFIASQVVKGPNGVSIKISLFLTKDHSLLSQAQLQAQKGFEVKGVVAQSEILLQKVLSKIPYDGMILSRQGQRVTLNLGTDDGIQANQIVSVIQIIKVTRHPKFQFLINSEKEILGKIKILKPDKNLSFGKIVSEKEKGAIQIHSKIAGVDFVSYGDPQSLSLENSGSDKLMNRADSKISFGKDAFAWLPQHPPSFGKVGALFGVGFYNGNKTPPAGDTKKVKDPYYPRVGIDMELWITNSWTTHMNIKQGIITTENSENISVSDYEFLLGYNKRFGSSLYGPKVEFLAGLASHRLTIDNPAETGFSSTLYKGLKFGVSGSYPIQAGGLWSLGAELFFSYNPNLTEVPSSGGGIHTMAEYGIFADRKLAQNLYAKLLLDFELYSSSFTSSSSLSQKHTGLSAGIYYMF